MAKIYYEDNVNGERWCFDSLVSSNNQDASAVLNTSFPQGILILEAKKMQQKNELIVETERNPSMAIDFARKAASQLQAIIRSKKKPVVINGEQYLEFEDWQTVATFYKVTAQVEWTKPIMEKDVVVGYEARAVALRKDGSQISAAESMCLKTEKAWANRDLFQLRSMAQTRACAKALRNVFSWVVVLAGFQGASAEEIKS